MNPPFRPGPAHAWLSRGTLRLAAILAAALPLTLASHASAAEVPDASCPGPNDFGTSAAKIAQTFTALNTGQLTSATMRTNRGVTTNNYLMEIRTVDLSGVPTNTGLASETVPAAGLPASTFTDITASFSAPASVVAGTKYALVLTRPGSNVFSEGRNSDPCAGGEYYYSDVLADPFIPSCSPSCDLLFAVLVSLRGQPPDTTAPDTEITQDPPNKTAKHKITYRFTSNEPGVTFLCKLDNKSLAPCASPFKKKVRDGKHKFLVQAKDAAGNVDPTPDKDKFKVVE